MLFSAKGSQDPADKFVEALRNATTASSHESRSNNQQAKSDASIFFPPLDSIIHEYKNILLIEFFIYRIHIRIFLMFGKKLKHRDLKILILADHTLQIIVILKMVNITVMTININQTVSGRIGMVIQR